MVVITMSSSVYNYLGVNIDRVLAIKYPLEYFVGRRWWARRNNVKVDTRPRTGKLKSSD